MDDLISRQAAIDAIKENMPDELAATASDLKIGYTCGMAQACVVLKGMPSAQPEIIRCKDCKHFVDEGMYCANDIIVQFDHFYCYDAERREDETD